MQHNLQFLILGTGHLVRKLKSTWQLYSERGVDLHSVDIIDEPVGRCALPSSTPFYNLSDTTQRRALVTRASAHPFDFVYVATFPDVHLASALSLDYMSRRFIFAKPIDSNVALLRTIFDARDSGFKNLIARSVVHDHYRNTALVTYLKSCMPELHRRNGFLRKVRVYIVDHNTVQSEFGRRSALSCGLIFDLGPHALSAISELIPVGIEWNDVEGHGYRRLGRRIEVVDVARARDSGSILAEDVETFGALHLRVTEEVGFLPRGHREVADTLRRDIELLVVVGKGLLVSRGEARDLKAVELGFDGGAVQGSFDTNVVSGVGEDPQAVMDAQSDPSCSALDRSLRDLLVEDSGVDAVQKKDAPSAFQGFAEAYRICELLQECREHPSARGLFHYRPLDLISDVINRCVARGLHASWALKDDLSHLVFGTIDREGPS